MNLDSLKTYIFLKKAFQNTILLYIHQKKSSELTYHISQQINLYNLIRKYSLTHYEKTLMKENILYYLYILYHNKKTNEVHMDI